MIISYYTGDTGKFLDYYDDYLKGEDKLMIIQETYKKMKSISEYMLVFVIIYSIQIGFRIIDMIIIYYQIKARSK